MSQCDRCQGLGIVAVEIGQDGNCVMASCPDCGGAGERGGTRWCDDADACIYVEHGGES